MTTIKRVVIVGATRVFRATHDLDALSAIYADDYMLVRRRIKGVTRRDVSAGPSAPARVAEPIADAPGRLSPANSVL